MIGLILACAAAIIGYTQSRSFVTARLKYVDSAHSPFVPLIAGGSAFAVGMVASVLPLLTAGTALAFGLSVGLGVASGQRELRRALPPG
ncbi:MAG: hypothetical protein ACT4OZ_05990 [Gemmatimonadota bacterium]